MSSEIWVALLSGDTSTAHFPKELGPYIFVVVYMCSYSAHWSSDAR